MTTVRIIIKQGYGNKPIDITGTVDRVPVAGDYIMPRPKELLLVKAVVLTMHGPISAHIFAINDPDDFPDEVS